MTKLDDAFDDLEFNVRINNKISYHIKFSSLNNIDIFGIAYFDKTAVIVCFISFFILQ